MAESPRDLFANHNRLLPNSPQGIGLRPVSTLGRATRFLAQCQSPAGVWAGVIRSTVRPTAEYVALLSVLNRVRKAAGHTESESESESENHRMRDSSDSRQHQDAIDRTQTRIRSAAAYIASQQSPTGMWSSSSRADDLDTSVLSYLALRLAGHDAQSEHLERARAGILGAGGVAACDPLTQYWFAVLGEQNFRQCLPLPPEFGLLPRSVPGAISRKHMLGRGILTAVSLLTAHQPIWSSTDGLHVLPELSGTPSSSMKRRWTYRIANQLLGGSPRRRNPSTRKHASRVAEAWLSRHIDSDVGGIAGDATTTVWATLALLACGRDESDDGVRSCLDFLESIQLTTNGLTEIGLAKADVRCTAIACRVLGATGVSIVDVPMQRSVDWLLANESHRFTTESSSAEMSGWSASGGKVHCVDVETTALVLLALREQFMETPPRASRSEDSMVAIVRASSASFARRQVALLDRMAAASRRSRRWLASMQNSDGGWGRFTRGPSRAKNTCSTWSQDLPDCDLSSPVVTSWVLEALTRWDLRRETMIRNAIGFLRAAQRPDGRWTESGSQSVFATWRAVTSLIAAGTSSQDLAIANGTAWLVAEQLKSGGWRDDACSSASATQILEPGSVVHTSWALLTLVAANVGHSSVAERAAQFLQQHQQSDGGWESDELATGYRASMDCGTEPYAAVAYPVLALTAWSKVR